MKAVSVLGTNSDAGKSWVATALCAFLRKKGIKVAPFKAQNMSNNSYVTLEGAEIGRAQAVQAEACGITPVAEVNPILLKPSGDSQSQLVLLGKAQTTYEAREYYKHLDTVRKSVEESLDYWKKNCDVLVMEGAGSPVELNLMQRDIVNLEPVRYLDGRWLLVADIERGGVFAQAYGTYQLMPEEDKKRGLGMIVNKFRGDIKLFADAEEQFRKIMDLPYMGTLPMRYDLQPESEDGFGLSNSLKADRSLPLIAWLRFPRISNTQDIQPWLLDEGVRAEWVYKLEHLYHADVIVLPGSKNTVADLQWLRETGMADVIMRRASEGVPIVGICGGYQMLGRSLKDPEGIAGMAGEVEGLSLLPIDTAFEESKIVTQVQAEWEDSVWDAYEIHMGRTDLIDNSSKPDTLIKIQKDGESHEEGLRLNKVWGTYLHGLFESPNIRRSLMKQAEIANFTPNITNWRDYQQEIYAGMADLLEEHIDLKYLEEYINF